MHWIAVRTAPDAQAELADVHSALAWWALRFTPLVARVEDTLLLEVSASERLFGGRQGLLLRLFDVVPVQPVHCTQGETALLALGRLWAQAPESAWQALPLHALVAARAHLPTLKRLGCKTWGQLHALPRAGLARRFGAELLLALDKACGRAPEVYPWLSLPEVFDARLELSAAVETAPALLFGARRLLAQLQVWLRARQLGVLALELRWELDARRSNTQHRDAHHTGEHHGQLQLRTAQATQDMQHLQRLLGEQLAQVTLPAPVLYLRLRSLQTQALAGESLSLLPEDQRKGDSLHQVLERLAARLGPEQVRWVQPLACHVPEQMQSWQPWTPALPPRTGTGTSTSPLAPHAALWPSWLLEQPLLLQQAQAQPLYQGPLALLAGPQRLESGWLAGEPVLRDYFVAHSPGAGLVWIYRERLATSGVGVQGDSKAQMDAEAGLRWYLHGLFA